MENQIIKDESQLRKELIDANRSFEKAIVTEATEAEIAEIKDKITEIEQEIDRRRKKRRDEEKTEEQAAIKELNTQQFTPQDLEAFHTYQPYLEKIRKILTVRNHISSPEAYHKVRIDRMIDKAKEKEGEDKIIVVKEDGYTSFRYKVAYTSLDTTDAFLNGIEVVEWRSSGDNGPGGGVPAPTYKGRRKIGEQLLKLFAQYIEDLQK